MDALNEQEKNKIENAFLKIAQFDLTIVNTDDEVIDIEKIKEKIEEIKPDYVFIDSLQLIKISDSETDFVKGLNDFMYEIKGCSRFRVNYNRQIGFPGLVIRNISYNIPKLEDLSLPKILNKIIQYPNGIILVTEPTGSGKSTTIASLIDL